MADGVRYEELKSEADRIFEAFEREFKRFERFVGDRQDAHFLQNLLKELERENFSLPDAEILSRELGDLRTRFTGKKSEWAAAKKSIGRVADPEERGWAGQHLLLVEVGMLDRFETARLNLVQITEHLRTQREAIDVTLPGRRPRRGHLHPITVV